MALPVSAGYQARIDTLNTGLAGLSDIFNPRRQSLAYDAAAGLNESGLTRNLSVDQVADPNGGTSVVYRLVRGQDGRLYSQAFRKIGQDFNSRGTYFSSFNERAQRDQRRELDAQRNQAMRQFASSQQGLTDQQADQERQLRGDLASARGDYADWQSQQQALSDQAAQAAAAQAAQAAAAGYRGTGPGIATGTQYRWEGSVAPNRSSLAERWGVPLGAIKVAPNYVGNTGKLHYVAYA